jgi:DNA-binding PadR family transcriptional regulator
LSPSAQANGYAIAQRLQQISKEFFQVHQGSLYPGLHRLEDKGRLQAEWKESETGREVKFYSLTKKGRRQMDAEILTIGNASATLSGSCCARLKRSPGNVVDSAPF